MARTVQEITITNIIARNPVCGSQVAHIARIFDMMLSAENNGCYSEAIADLDTLTARLAAHRTSLRNCIR